MHKLSGKTEVFGTRQTIGVEKKSHKKLKTLALVLLYDKAALQQRKRTKREPKETV